MLYLMQFLFIAAPVAAVILFIICLGRYRAVKKRSTQQPGSASERELKTAKLLMIVFAVIAAVIVAVVIGFIALLFMAIAFM